MLENQEVYQWRTGETGEAPGQILEQHAERDCSVLRRGRILWDGERWLSGVVVIGDGRRIRLGAQHAAPLPASQLSSNARPHVQAGSLGTIIRSCKSTASRRINASRGTPRTSVWQRNYFERVIRNEDELHRIRQYIDHNPLRWELDPEHPAALRRRCRRGGFSSRPSTLDVIDTMFEHAPHDR